MAKRNRLRYVLTPFGKNESIIYDVKKFEVSLTRRDSSFDKYRLIGKWRTLLYYCRIYTKSYAAWKKLGIDKNTTTIIFTEYYTWQFDIIIYMARLLKIPYGIVFHGLDLICVQKRNFRHFRGNFSGADFIIFNSKATEALCNTLFHAVHERSVVIYPGIDVPMIESVSPSANGEKSLRTDPDAVIFTTVSRLVYRKGIDIAIRIVSDLAKKNGKIRYYIGGSGNERENLEALVKQLNAEEYIFFLGGIDNDKKYQLLRDSDFFILPNHSAGNNDFEGFGISFIEASFFGNIIIGGNHGGVKEAVSDQETGFLFDFDDEASIDKAVAVITACIDNPQLMQKIKKNGVEYVKSRYDWNFVIERLFQLEQ